MAVGIREPDQPGRIVGYIYTAYKAVNILNNLAILG